MQTRACSLDWFLFLCVLYVDQSLVLVTSDDKWGTWFPNLRGYMLQDQPAHLTCESQSVPVPTILTPKSSQRHILPPIKVRSLSESCPSNHFVARPGSI